MFSSDIQIETVVFSVFKSVFIVYCFGGAGAFFARRGIINKASNKTLSLISLYYFLPALFFVNTMRVFTQKAITDLWFLIILPIFHIAIYFLLGSLGAHFFFPKYVKAFKFVLASSVAFCNCGDLVMSILSTLGHTDLLANPNHSKHALETGEERISRAIGYVSIYVLIWTMIAWTWLWNALDQISMDQQQQQAQQQAATMIPLQDMSNDSRSSKFPMRQQHDEDGTVSISIPSSATTTSTTAGEQCNSKTEGNNRVEAVPGVRQGWWPRFKESLLKLLQTPPLMCTVLGMIFGVTPQLRGLFFTEDPESESTPHLEFITKAFFLVGNAAIPLNMLVLGANLASGMVNQTNLHGNTNRDRTDPVVGGILSASAMCPAQTRAEHQNSEKRVSNGWTSLFLCVMRLLIAPMVGIGIGLLLSYSGLVDKADYLLKFTIMAVTMGPTGTTIVIMCQLKDLYIADTSNLIFQQYIVGLLTIPFAVIVMVIVSTSE